MGTTSAVAQAARAKHRTVVNVVDRFMVAGVEKKAEDRDAAVCAA
jgi:hypothetical protein